MSLSCQKTLPDVRETLSDVQKWTEGPLGCPGVVGRPSLCPGMVGRPSRMSGSGQEALPGGRDIPDDREYSVGPPGCPRVVGRLFRMSGVVVSP